MSQSYWPIYNYGYDIVYRRALSKPFAYEIPTVSFYFHIYVPYKWTPKVGFVYTRQQFVFVIFVIAGFCEYIGNILQAVSHYGLYYIASSVSDWQ